MATTTKLEWKDTSIKAQSKTGKEIDVPVREAVGTGLCYYIIEPDDGDEDDIPWYAILHAPSSSKIPLNPILIEEEAKRLVAAFAPLTDWTRSLDELTADPQYQDVVQQVVHLFETIDTKFWDTLMEQREDNCW
jgi:hypothetical protein